MNTPTRQTSNQLSAYAIFLILERQRNLKLRELYRNNPVVDTLLPVISEEDSSSSSSSTTTTTSRKSSLRQAMKQKMKHDASSSHTTMSTLPRFPPRYQALANIITPDVLMMQLRTTSTSQRSSSRHRSSSSQLSSCSYSSSSFYMEEYKHLDQVTRQFLIDTVKILEERCMEEIENNEAMLEIHMKRSIMNRRRMKVGEKKLFTFRVERKLSLIVD
eukprot:CAMPEP_0201689066 /NCGR_PEP_ID=MMETSP0578-20130828/2727_1 /ASSEMBLY_ACC=CAM_ASM_000663 /TAXON_ID=267565 /ORGANISM="Skeletonema grethea, Strain CCMP 1804" /LENGTH=216 /DNA_ID=CAMNT_0048173587 /DNA_START=156 /DNA_END=806 /DNA_ORIENTATION=-